MFAGIYHDAARLGIAPALLDQSPLHVVRWMLEGTPTGLDPSSEAAVRAQRLAASRGNGALPEYEPFDVGMIGGPGA